MIKVTLIWGAVYGLLTVAIGAFGAHGLHDILEANGRKETFEIGVRYMAYHSLALLVIGMLQQLFTGVSLNWAVYSMILGVLIFSGSLFTLSLTNLRFLGAITPIGGLLLILGWAKLIYGIIRNI